jgi:hypothetical protein
MDNKVNIKGIVVDKSQSPIKGASIIYNTFSTFTNDKGEFILEITPNPNINEITISAPNFSESKKKIIRRNGRVKENVGVIILTSFEDSIQEEITSQISLNDIEEKTLINSSSNFEQLQQKRLRDLIKTLKYTLIPIILKLLLNFGITKIQEALLKKTTKNNNCPNPDRLKKIIEKRNKLVKQLNITFTSIDVTLKSLGILQGILIATEISLKAIPLIPLPSPPAVPILGGELDSQVKKFKNINGGLLVILFILRGLLSRIIELLESLDFQIQSCLSDSSELESLNLDIINQLNQLNQETPLSSFEKVNGFSFDIETEPTTNEIKRKRAVAKNSKGVILLRGEYSYSSSTQILIEELAFFIKINNLKAD